jgi:hypothetical protein
MLCLADSLRDKGKDVDMSGSISKNCLVADATVGLLPALFTIYSFLDKLASPPELGQNLVF